MGYTNKRLNDALRVYRSFRVASNNRQSSSSTSQCIPTKYAFRSQVNSGSNLHGFRSHIDESDVDDEDFDPNEEKRKKQSSDRKPTKRKAANSEEDGQTSKKSKTTSDHPLQTRPSTEDELLCKDAFITIKVTTNSLRKQLLETLAIDFKTHIKFYDGKRNSTLALAQLDPMAFDAHLRHKQCTTWEEKHLAECKLDDNTGGKRLRNRKVAEVADTFRPKKKRPQRYEDNGKEVSASTAIPACVKTPQPALKPSYNYGLLSPASTPEKARSVRKTYDLEQSSPPDDVISISSSSSRSSSPPPSYSLQAGIERITTKWAHPIDFMHNLVQGQPACHFCEDVMFGAFGLATKRVLVERINKGNKCFREICDGNIAEGKETTRMCIKCSLGRYYIASCSEHKLKLLPGLDPQRRELSSTKLKAYMEQITLHNQGNKIKQSIHPICSLCPCYAAYQCCTKQVKSETGGVLPHGQEREGCGLLVCSLCRMVLLRNHGVLSRRAFQTQGDRYAAAQVERTFRADFDFLLEGSLLHEAWQHLAGKSAGRK